MTAGLCTACGHGMHLHAPLNTEATYFICGFFDRAQRRQCDCRLNDLLHPVAVEARPTTEGPRTTAGRRLVGEIWRLHFLTESALAKRVAMIEAEADVDVDRLKRALIESDLIHRYSEYAIQAGLPKEPVEVVANAWAHHIAVAYYGQVTDG